MSLLSPALRARLQNSVVSEATLLPCILLCICVMHPNVCSHLCISLKLTFCDFLSRFASRVAQLEADGRLLTRNEAICLSSPSLPY